MTRKIILVDMDGVIANFEKSLSVKLASRYPNIKPIYSKRTNFDFDKDYLESDRPKIKEIYSSEGFFRNLEPIKGSLEALSEISKNNDVFICTSPLNAYQNCVLEKYEWVNKHLGADFVKRIILTKDKTLVRGDYLIDDKPTITGVMAPTWKHLVFEAPYNKGVQKPRINWNNYKELFM